MPNEVDETKVGVGKFSNSALISGHYGRILKLVRLQLKGVRQFLWELALVSLTLFLPIMFALLLSPESVIEPIKFENKSLDLSPEAVAVMLREDIENIQAKADSHSRSHSHSAFYIDHASRSAIYARLRLHSDTVDFLIPDTNISIRSLTQYLKELFGIGDFRLVGEITSASAITNGKQVSELRMQISSSEGVPIPAAYSQSASGIEPLVQMAAENYIKTNEPTTYAAYIYNSNDSDTRAKAISILRAAISTRPAGDSEIAWAYQFWGRINDDANTPSEAIAKYDVAIALSPRTANIYNDRGIAWLRMPSSAENAEAAVNDFRTAIDLNDEFPPFYANYADALRRQYTFSRNSELLRLAHVADQAAVRLDPGDSDAYIGLGNTATAEAHSGAELQLDKIREAIGYFDKARDLEGSKALALGNLGESYDDLASALPGAERKKALAQALNCYNEALKLTPFDAFTLDARAEIFVDLGQLDAAKRDAQAAVELDRKAKGSFGIEARAKSVLAGIVGLSLTTKANAERDAFLQRQAYAEACKNLQKARRIEYGPAPFECSLRRIARHRPDIPECRFRVIGIDAVPMSCSGR